MYLSISIQVDTKFVFRIQVYIWFFFSLKGSEGNKSVLVNERTMESKWHLMIHREQTNKDWEGLSCCALHFSMSSAQNLHYVSFYYGTGKKKWKQMRQKRWQNKILNLVWLLLNSGEKTTPHLGDILSMDKVRGCAVRLWDQNKLHFSAC